MANETITIECLPGGGYHVTSTEDSDAGPGDKPLDQTVQSVDEVLQLVQQELSDDEQDPQAAWAAEAQTRGPDGTRGSAPQAQPGGPQMTM
jgi:hypothetical protein